MYIYFSETGLLQEIVSIEETRKGNSEYNHIYAYVDNLPSTYLSASITFKDSTNTIVLGERVEKVIPYSETRNYKYFKDYTTYKFFDITIPDEVLATSGLKVATLSITLGNKAVFNLGDITFNVEDSAIVNDSFITLSQYNYLLKLIEAHNSVYDKSVIATPDEILDNEELDLNETYCNNRLVISSYNDKFSLFKIVVSPTDTSKGYYSLIISTDISVNKKSVDTSTQTQLNTLTLNGITYYVKDSEIKLFEINKNDKDEKRKEVIDQILARKDKYFARDVICINISDERFDPIIFYTTTYTYDNTSLTFTYHRIIGTSVDDYTYVVGLDGEVKEFTHTHTDLSTTIFAPTSFELDFTSGEDLTSTIEEIVSRSDYDTLDDYNVIASEVKDNSLTQAMYLSESEKNALDSGITASKVKDYDLISMDYKNNAVKTALAYTSTPTIPVWSTTSSKTLMSSEYTIDTLIEKAKVNNVDLIATGALTSYDLNTLLQYDIVIITGYKNNVGTPNITTFSFDPSSVGTSATMQFVAQAGPSNWEYTIRLTKDTSKIYWWTNLEYSGSNAFTATKLIGIKVGK